MFPLLQLGVLLATLANHEIIENQAPLANALANGDLARPHNSKLPIVVNTWAFKGATHEAWHVLKEGGPPLDAIEAGCSFCEREQCDGTVGYGGSPDEMGETTLDALIMNGDTMDVGAVASLRHVKEAITTARLVLERTEHSMLAGVLATQFAQEMGMDVSNLTTEDSARMHKRWENSHCQPNFRKNVSPDPARHCGPYSPLPSLISPKTSLSPPLSPSSTWPTVSAHDTIAIIAIDTVGSISAGCSTNGATNKIPGRVGDCAVAGGGAYADSDVGGCGATGNGDIHLRFLPCFQVVESMRRGAHPKEAAEEAVARMAKKVPGYIGAVVAVDKDGRHGAACYGWNFTYAYRDMESKGVELVYVDPIKLEK